MAFFDRWKSLLPILLCCLIIVFGIFANPTVIPYFINSDTLQPTQMAWDMSRHAYAIPNFQWSRVPSFPDLVFFFLMDWAHVGWRTSFLIYSCLVAVSASLSLGWVVSRMRGSTFGDGAFWAGIAVFSTLLSVMVTILTSPQDAVQQIPQSFLFICNSHGDAFLISIFASCSALGAIRGDKRQAWVSWALCAVGTASDTIFPGYFLLPFAVACMFVIMRRREIGSHSSALPLLWPTLHFLLAAGLACLVGWIAKYPLPMQSMPLDIQGLDVTVVRILHDLPNQPWIVTLLALTLFLSVRAAWTFWKPATQAQPSTVEVDRELLMLTGLAASVMSLGLTALLFTDAGGYRYALPLFWWPMALGIGIVRRLSQAKVTAAVATVATLTTAALPLSTSVLPGWRTPLEQCLSDNRREWNLKAGLATYWHSRITMVSSDWTLQVDQIDETGQAYLWGNNVAAYAHDMHSPQRPPEYNFIVADKTTSAFDLEVNFGPADRVETCGDAEIWIYNAPITPPGLDHIPSG